MNGEIEVMHNTVKKLWALLLVAALAGCGGGDNAFKGTGTGTGTTPVVSLSLTIGVPSLSAGGSTSVIANLKDSTGTPYVTATDVTLSSSCASVGKATLVSPVSTINGTAISTYVAKGCQGDDPITASAVVGSSTLIATVSVNVLSAALGSIQFVSSTPSSITLKGTGGAGRSETSTVIFKLLDSSGGPVSNQDVAFELDTTVGGLALSPPTAKSNADGTVQTVVQAGTVATPVRVRATIAGTSIATQSDGLVITTGIPDQDSFSLSASVHNIEGLTVDGVETQMTARLSDHFNNPVPDGTTITFTTESGSVVSSCSTSNGACGVTLASSGVRPLNGRATVLAYAIGEESFVDKDGDGYADKSPAELFDINGTPSDMGEAFVDYSENGSRDADEPFIDFNSDGSFAAAGDTFYNGILCNEASGKSSAGTCSPTSKTIHVRNSQVIVFSGSTAVIKLDGVPIDSAAAINLPQCSTTVPFANVPVAVDILIHDVNGNVMPAGTKVEFSTTNGKIESEQPAPVADSRACVAGFPGCPASATPLPGYKVQIISDATQSGTAAPYTCTNTKSNGLFTVKVTSPRGLITPGTTGITD